jgi:hypothetical protein
MTNDDVVQAYVDGLTFAEVARRFDLSTEQVRCRVRKAGVSSRGNTSGKYSEITNDLVDKILELYGLGQSKTRIARDLGLLPFHVKRVLEDNGISPEQRWAVRGDHPNWRGGRWIDPASGYVWVRLLPNDPLYPMSYKGPLFEHRYAMAKHLGRLLTENETVHHKDGDKQNNDPENLQLRQGNHGKGATFTCQDCGSHNIVAGEL